MKLPKVFKADPSNDTRPYRKWFPSVENYMKWHNTPYEDDIDKIILIGGVMDGKTGTWYDARAEYMKRLFKVDEWNPFVSAMEDRLLDRQEDMQALGKIRELKYNGDMESYLQQQNVNWSGSNTQSSPTLRATSRVLLSTSWCSQTSLELSNVLSDCARAFSGVPESTCSYEGVFRILRDLTYRIVKFWSYSDLCANLRKTSREAATAAQFCDILWEQPRPLHSSAGDLVLYSHSSGSYITRRQFVSITVTRFATS